VFGNIAGSAYPEPEKVGFRPSPNWCSPGNTEASLKNLLAHLKSALIFLSSKWGRGINEKRLSSFFTGNAVANLENLLTHLKST